MAPMIQARFENKWHLREGSGLYGACSRPDFRKKAPQEQWYDVARGRPTEIFCAGRVRRPATLLTNQIVLGLIEAEFGEWWRGRIPSLEEKL